MAEGDVPRPAVSDEEWEALQPALRAAVEALASPGDEALQARAEAAAHGLRGGPALRPGELVFARHLLLEHDHDGPLVAAWSGYDLGDRRPVHVHVLHAYHQRAGDRVARFREAHIAYAELAAAAVPVATGSDAARVWEGFDVRVHPAPGPSVTSMAPSDPGHEALIVEIVEAVAQVHRAGAVHGALAPGSVRLNDGRVTLSELGLTAPGATGVYAPPESAAPDWVPSPASDLYALAMLLLRVHRGQDLPYWAARAPERVIGEAGLPDPWTPLLTRMVDWDPQARPDIDEVLAAALGDAEHRRQLAHGALAAGRPDVAAMRLEALLADTPDDRGAKRALVTARAESGDPSGAATLLAELLADPAGDPTERGLEQLEALVEQTGDRGPWLATLRSWSEHQGPRATRAAFGLARWHDAQGQPSAEAWGRALEVHQRRDEAREALARLMELCDEADDAAGLVAWGRELYGYQTEDPDRASLAHRIGTLFLETLDDPDNGLLWLDRAMQFGVDDADLQGVLRRLRSARGEWRELLGLLEDEAGSSRGEAAVVALRAAAHTAARGLGDHERAGMLFDQLLLRDDTDVEALRHRAATFADQGMWADAARALGTIGDPDPDDRCAWIDALVAAGDGAAAWQVARDGLGDSPHHHGLLTRALPLGLGHAPAAVVVPVAAALLEVAGPGPGRREALLVLADAALDAGELARADALVRRLTRDDGDDAEAWWLQVRLAWTAARTEAEPAWLRAVPERFPPHEAVARLVAGLLRPDAVRGWLDSSGAACSAGATPLECAGEVVRRVDRHGQVEALLDALTAIADDDGPWIGIVRRFWRGEIANDQVFPIAIAEAWGAGRGAEPRGQRSTVGPSAARSARRADDPADWTSLLVRDETRPLSEEGAAPRMLELAPQPVVEVTAPGEPTQRVALGAELRIGSGPEATIVLPDGPEERCRIVMLADRAYVVAEPAVEVDGTLVDEARLDDRARIRVDGLELLFLADATHEDHHEATPPPAGPAGQPDDWLDEPTQSGVAPDPIRAALFYRSDGSERILPLTGPRFEIGPDPDADVHVGEGTGWLARIERPELGMYLLSLSGQTGKGSADDPRLLFAGESFEVAGVRFEFQVVQARTPLPAPPRRPPPRDVVPVLILDDGSLLGQVMPITGDTFTIGRGRRNDLNLNSDGKLSRHHCTMLVDTDGSVRIRDHNSANGTYVDGHPIDEQTLAEGATIQLGDTELEFRWGQRDALLQHSEEGEPPALFDGPEAGDAHPEERKRTFVPTPSLTVDEGREKLAATNAALAAVIDALDLVHGPGRGQAYLQLALDASPRRFKRLFDGVDAKRTGLPAMVILFNAAQHPHPAQRPLLNSALGDLVDRVVGSALEQLPDDRSEALLEAVADTCYRDALRT